MGGLGIVVPRYAPSGVRFFFNDTATTEIYTRLGAVHVQLRDDHVRVSNPGSFVEGVGPDNLLVTEPRPRNPRLADAFKRVGLVERTGRGVETIYRGQLRNGRPPPDYTLSTAASVSVILPSRPADLDFVLLAVQAGRRMERALEGEELLALWQAWREGPVTAQALAPALQRSTAHASHRLVGQAQACLAPAAQGRLSVHDLFLEQRRHHRRRGAGIFRLLQRVGILRQRAGGDHQRVLQLQSQVGCANVDAHELLSFSVFTLCAPFPSEDALAALSAATARSTLANCS